MQNTAEQQDILRDRMLAHLERIKAQAQEDHEASDDELFNQADAEPTNADTAEAPEAETTEGSSKDDGEIPTTSADIAMDTAKKKKKKKKKRKPKTAGLPEAGSTIPDDYVEKYNEDPELDIFNPARPIAQRVEFAMAKYRKNHKFTISKKNIFDDYLRFGGINTGPNAFQGRTTGADNPGDELAEDDYGAAKAGIDSIEDDDEDVSVSFKDVAQIYFGSRFIRQSKFIQLSEFQDAPEVVDAFLRYLQIRNVCPEYAEDIQAARDICARARLELPRCKILITLLPDKFNQACSVLFEGNQKDIMDFVPTWNTGDSKLQATYGSFMADTIGMTKDEAMSIVGPVVGDVEKRKVVDRKLVQRVRVVEIEGQESSGVNPGEKISDPVLLGSTSADSQHAVAGIYVKVTISDIETSLTNYTILMEKRISDQILPKLVFTADFYKLDNGQWYIDQVNSIFPSFFLEDDEASDENL